MIWDDFRLPQVEANNNQGHNFLTSRKEISLSLDYAQVCHENGDAQDLWLLSSRHVRFIIG
jgi:hypothetical protein